MSVPSSTPNNALLLDIQALNDAAASYLDDGFVQEAHQVLGQATTKLSQCQVLLPTESSSSRTATPPHGSVQSKDQDDHSCDSVVDDDDCDMVSDDEEEMSDDDMPEFYPYPFTFQYKASEVQAQESWITLEQYRTCAITCLFNLGLCHHLAWDDEPLQTNLLHRALVFYQKAIALILKKDSKTGSSYFQTLKPEHPLFKLVLAICINASQCHTELVQYDKIAFWQNLIQTLAHQHGSLVMHNNNNNSSTMMTRDLQAMKGYLAKHMQGPWRHSPEMSAPAA
eukprot:CAMPEP_0172460494 /NCGR_PEP_ID=MMETSP1065-20121228/37104_1 /TAXON_ID=265537 /ORGANISM="Amphiprora paludosa, Strain CCMP125" /LENGTH=281 /DNA_ID=CAMNT_0013215535 /DNA_START=47 /DNA_END=892 /DNA_ORIENTATION=+